MDKKDTVFTTGYPLHQRKNNSYYLNLWNDTMTDKQKITLVWFAQNYSLQTIAKKQGVSLATIRERIKSLSKHYPIEFANTIDLRNTYKRNRDNLKNTLRFSDLDITTGKQLSEHDGEKNSKIKEKF